MKKDFINMLVDLMLLDRNNGLYQLEQFVELYEIDTNTKEYKKLKDFVENYEEKYRSKRNCISNYKQWFI